MTYWKWSSDKTTRPSNHIPSMFSLFSDLSPQNWHGHSLKSFDWCFIDSYLCTASLPCLIGITLTSRCMFYSSGHLLGVAPDPLKDMLKSYLLLPHNVTSLGNRVFREVIKMKSLQWTIIHDWCSYTKEKFGHRNRYPHREDCVKHKGRMTCEDRRLG